MCVIRREKLRGKREREREREREWLGEKNWEEGENETDFRERESESSFHSLPYNPNQRVWLGEKNWEEGENEKDFKDTERERGRGGAVGSFERICRRAPVNHCRRPPNSNLHFNWYKLWVLFHMGIEIGGFFSIDFLDLAWVGGCKFRVYMRIYCLFLHAV